MKCVMARSDVELASVASAGPRSSAASGHRDVPVGLWENAADPGQDARDPSRRTTGGPRSITDRGSGRAPLVPMMKTAEDGNETTFPVSGGLHGPRDRSVLPSDKCVLAPW